MSFAQYIAAISQLQFSNYSNTYSSSSSSSSSLSPSPSASSTLFHNSLHSASLPWPSFQPLPSNFSFESYSQPYVVEGELVRLKRKHTCPSSVQHWQLRHLVCCPNDEEVYTVHQGSIECYNLAAEKSSTITKLSYYPTALDVNFGYIAVCGQEGHLSVYSLESRSFIYSQVITQNIINAVHLCKYQGEIRLIVPTNANDVKIYTLPSMQEIACLKLNVAANYASVSSDESKLLIVGDCVDVHVYNISGNSYTHAMTFSEAKDHGFSCSWHPSSNVFAAASQDGVVNVWDIRYSKSLAKLYSKQRPSTKGACRNVKFSQKSTVDLLTFSEHVSYFHVVDSRTFATQQTICAAPIGPEGIISGLAFNPSNDSLFVGLDSTLNEYSTDSLKRRAFPNGDLIN